MSEKIYDIKIGWRNRAEGCLLLRWTDLGSEIIVRDQEGNLYKAIRKPSGIYLVIL